MALRGTCLSVWLFGCLLLCAGVGEAQEQNPLAIQEALIWTGHYKGPLDGEIGPGTVVAIKRFQAKMKRPNTGSLSQIEWSTLRDQASQARSGAGFTEITDEKTGVGIGIPTAFIKTKRDVPYGSDYVSPNGDMLIGVRRYRQVGDPTSDLESLLNLLAGSLVEYKVQKSDWFVIAGSIGEKKYYMRFHWKGPVFAGFYAIYQERQADKFQTALSMMSFKLEPFASQARGPPATTLSSLPLESPFSLLLSNNQNVPLVATPKPEVVAKGLSSESPTDAPKQPPSPQADDAAASRLLLDSLQQLLEKSGDKNVKFVRYTVDKSLLKGFRSDMPVLRVVYEERVFFDTDKTALRAEAGAILESVATALRSKQGPVALFVAGHADSRGTDEYNLALSVKRADSVALALGGKGVGSASVWRVGFGKAVPVRPNTSPQNMAYNRRVEFLLASQTTVVAAWIKSTKTLCEGLNIDCGGPPAAAIFEAIPIGGEGLKPINVEVPARPVLVQPTSIPAARPALPQIVPERPSLRELEPLPNSSE